ncbi:MAG TPA: APC family permease, partial [Candidatus Angelobacter sp.]|nr:APC family permease [Candidatus Angelobacter sp.]
MSPSDVPRQPELIRGVSLAGATTLNVIDMIGVGPFITLPLIVSAAGGPQAMLGWIFGAVFALCDGLIWAELGAAMPEAGGSYQYLKQIYGPKSLGRLLSFLFIWQLSFSAPLSIASGCVGLAHYAGYIWPGLGHTWLSHTWHAGIPLLGSIEVTTTFSPGTLAAMTVCAFIVFLLFRRITVIARLAEFLWVGVAVAIAWIIFAGLTHFNAARAFDFPPGAFHLSPQFFTGMGAAMLIATYDYWGYYNVCFLGAEVKDPGRNIPRALILSIVAVAAIYVVMNISVLGVVPWREMLTHTGEQNNYIVAVFMERIYGSRAGRAIALLIIWTAFASVFSLLLGYSRVPYAAALDGNYFAAFARVHPEKRFPTVSLLALGAVAILFCLLRLADLIAALVVIRILLQFIVQAIGVMVLRHRQPDMPRPFRMWLYPLPALMAIAGFLYVLFARKNFQREIKYAVVVLIVGLIVYFVRSQRRHEWPFASESPAAEL